MPNLVALSHTVRAHVVEPQFFGVLGLTGGVLGVRGWPKGHAYWVSSPKWLSSGTLHSTIPYHTLGNTLLPTCVILPNFFAL